jgi:myo-inositol catabolism protein IolS
MTMRTIRFGRTNVQVPAVSLGTWGYSGPTTSAGLPVGWSGHDDRLAFEALLKAYESGITHWDTADVYGNGNAERLIGKVWKQIPRDDVFLATKVGWNPGGFDHYYHPELIQKQMEQSLRNLQTDVIDLYYLHHCDFGPGDRYLDGAISLLRRFRDEGKIRFIGLSDWDSAKVLRVIDRVDPDVIQPYRNVVDDAFESSGLKHWVDEHDVGVAFFSPLKHGLLLGKYSEPTEFPDGDFRRRIPEFRDPAALARMQEARDAVTQRFGDRPQPVMHALVGALLAGCPTACVLIGQRNIRQVAAAATAGEPLSPRDAEWVKAVYRGEGVLSSQ